jgi:hypothetical protein
MEDISLIILNNYSLLTITNSNGSAIELKLTHSQLAYIEERISATKSVNQLLTAMKAGN